MPAPLSSPPWPTPGPALTCPWKRREGQGAARAQEPQGPEQRQPHDSGARGRRGRQVPGRAPSRSGGRVCFAHCAARGPRQAPPLPSHRVRARPRPARRGPAPGEAPLRSAESQRSRSGPGLRWFSARTPPSCCCAGWEPRPVRPAGASLLHPPQVRTSSRSVAASRLQSTARPCGDRGQFSPLPAGQRPASSPSAYQIPAERGQQECARHFIN